MSGFEGNGRRGGVGGGGGARGGGGFSFMLLLSDLRSICITSSLSVCIGGGRRER